MAKIQNFKRIVAEEFQEKDRPSAQKIGYSVNVFCEDVQNTLNKNITIDDNININKKDFTVVVDAGGVVTSQNSLRTDLDHNCQGIMVIKADNLTNAANTPSGTPFVSFSENASKVLTINKITNLTANEKYKLKLLLI